jgi:AmpD protein
VTIDAGGRVRGARWVPSPHFDPRPPQMPIDLLVLHAISLPAGEYGGDAIERLFTGRLDPGAHPTFASLQGLRVSAHFLVDRGGRLLQFVACGDRAWHAGESSFEGRARCNDFSIGVELEGCDTDPFAPAQYAALARLARTLAAAYPLRAVRGHSDIAPGRKTDPGPHFDWRRFAAATRLPWSLPPGI